MQLHLSLEFDSSWSFEEFSSFLFFSKKNGSLSVGLLFSDDSWQSFSFEHSCLIDKILFSDESFSLILKFELSLLLLSSEDVLFILLFSSYLFNGSKPLQLLLSLKCLLHPSWPSDLKLSLFCVSSGSLKIFLDSKVNKKDTLSSNSPFFVNDEKVFDYYMF